MRIVFLPGGYLNEQGPYEAGEEISVPEAVALQLIANGLATPIAPVSSRPITVTIKLQESNHV